MFKTIDEALEAYKKALEEFVKSAKEQVRRSVMVKLEKKLGNKAAKKKYEQMTEYQRFRASEFYIPEKNPFCYSSYHVDNVFGEQKLKTMAQTLGLTPEEQSEIKAEIKAKLRCPSAYLPRFC